MIIRYDLINGALAESPVGPVTVYVSPDAAERAALCQAHGVDEHTLNSALDPDEVPRLEQNGETLSLIWKRALNCSGKDNFYFNVSSLGLFLTGDRLSAVMDQPLPLLEGGGRFAPRMTGARDLFFAVLLGTIQHYLGHLKVIKMISHDLQKRINTSMANESLIQMFNLSESLVYYTNAISANGIVLGRLRTAAEKMGYDQRSIETVDDIIIENNQCLRQAEIYSTVFSGLMDARGSLVNNNMSMLLKNLTIINIVFLPLNLIAGIGGMSEYSMMTQGVDWRIAYGVFGAAMVVLGWFTAYILGKVNFMTMNPFAVFSFRRKKK